jgi:dihydroorotate dehydrogenase
MGADPVLSFFVLFSEYNKDAWIEIMERSQETGIDAIELNFSCPHGLLERKMGSAMGIIQPGADVCDSGFQPTRPRNPAL